MEAEQNVRKYWAIVRACMIEAFNMQDHVVDEKIFIYQSLHPSCMTVSDIIFHQSPILTAQDLLEIPVDQVTDKHWAIYREIVRRYY